MFVVKATPVTGRPFSVNSKTDMRITNAQQIVTAGEPGKRFSMCEVVFTSCLIVGTPEVTGGEGKATQNAVDLKR
jgi:hypothetical protein